jgi:hypothetical protein
MKAKEWVQRISALDPESSEYEKAAVECERECREIFKMRADSIRTDRSPHHSQSAFQRNKMSDRLVFAYKEASVKWDSICHALLNIRREKEGPDAPPTWPFVKGLMLLTDIVSMLENTTIDDVQKAELLRYFTMVTERLGYQNEVVFKAALSLGRERTQVAVLEEIMALRRELNRLQAAMLFGTGDGALSDFNRILAIRKRLVSLTS